MLPAEPSGSSGLPHVLPADPAGTTGLKKATAKKAKKAAKIALVYKGRH